MVKITSPDSGVSLNYYSFEEAMDEGGIFKVEGKDLIFAFDNRHMLIFDTSDGSDNSFGVGNENAWKGNRFIKSNQKIVIENE